ncbi:MAG TPA: ATP-binding protein [Gemmataceae bacterium]|nr:ATP-binding protein [Gemmataceae bacterium]
MARLVLTQGPQAGREFPLEGGPWTVGRQPGLQIFLDAPEVSRQHARVSQAQGRFYVEDLGSSNGTYLNRLRLRERAELRDQDDLQIGPFQLVFHGAAASEPELLIRAELQTLTAHRIIIQEGAGRKLLAVLEVTRQLARTLDTEELLPRLLDHLLGLFPHAERGLILVREGDELVVRALRGRAPREGQPAYSRSVVRRAFEEGVGLLADNPRDDPRFALAQTLMALGVRSFLCVPLQAHGGRALGVVQLDRFGTGTPFTPEDLHLLAAVSIPISVVLENAALHARAVENERVQRDLELARLAQLVAGVAHEVNNPLAFVSNNLTLLGRDAHALGELAALYQQVEGAASEEAEALRRRARELADEIDVAATRDGLAELLTRTKDGVKRIEKLVKDLRDFARLDQAAWDEADVGAGVASVLSVIHGRAERQGVTLHADLEPLPRVWCHPAKINQVVFHLVANAIDASPPGSRVTVRARPAEGGVELAVIDAGHGIDPAIRDKVFDPFYTTRPLGQGAGLGLSISYGIVQSHGGTIDFESAPGQGTSFRVRLPQRPPITPPRKASVPTPAPQ